MASLRIAVAVVLLAMVTGCGGGDPESFRADANAICKKRIDAIEESARQAEAGNGSDEALVAAYDDELEALRDVDPPSEHADAYEEMLALYEQGADSVREFADLRKQAAEATDRETYNERVNRSGDAMAASRRSRSKGNKIAGDIGLDTCATPLY